MFSIVAAPISIPTNSVGGSVAPEVFHLAATYQQGPCCLLSRTRCCLNKGDIHLLLESVILDRSHDDKYD